VVTDLPNKAIATTSAPARAPGRWRARVMEQMGAHSLAELVRMVLGARQRETRQFLI
jgi:FixJ family two-component response regulator